MDNPEKLSTLGTQDEDKHNKNKTCCWTPLCTQKKPTNNGNKTWTLLQTTGAKDEPNIFLCGNRNGHTWTLKHKDT
jgi:hypothetical protein